MDLVKRIRPRARSRNETAARILAAALEVFAERGFDGTTTREIAGRAGVNLGLIKYYFDTKEKLWRAAVDEVVARLWTALGELPAADAAAPERFEQLVRAAVGFAARNPAFIRLMNDECKRDSRRMRWLVDRHGRRLYETAGELLATARREGVVPDVPVTNLYYAFIGAVGMIFSQAPECRRLCGDDPTESAAMIEAHAETVVRLFLHQHVG